MAGIRAFRKIQLGRETTAGTAVAATTIWRGVGTIEDQRELTVVEEDIGFFSGGDRSYISKLYAALSMDETPATFEQLPYILEAGVKAVQTGASGGGSAKEYIYTMPTSSPNTLAVYTLEGGDNQQAEKMEYSFVDQFKISGKPGEAVMMSADWFGRQATNASFTGALSLPTVEDILFQKGKLYIDDVSGTMGTTQVSNSFLGMDLTVKTGVTPVWTGDGNLYFSFTKAVRPEVTLEITFEHDSSSVAEKTNWRNLTSRLIRVQFDGTALTTAGTNFANKALRIDLAGKWSKFDKIDEMDGNDIIKATFVAKYNATAAKFAEFTVCNTLTSLT